MADYFGVWILTFGQHVFTSEFFHLLTVQTYSGLLLFPSLSFSIFKMGKAVVEVFSDRHVMRLDRENVVKSA